MKKFLLFLMFAMFCIPWVTNAQTTVTIGDGTATCNTNPFGTYYNYSIAEQLYTAEEIGMAGTISSISFYYMGTAAKDFPITVYMANVDAADLSAGGISLADADEVFSGTLSVPAEAGWVTITLDAPFAYDGTSSLLIGCLKDYVYYFSGQTWQGTATTATMARYTQQDGSAYTTGTTPGTAQTNRPNIQMVITAGSGPVCEKPETMDASNVTTNSAVITWSAGSGTYNVEYKLASETEWTSLLTNTTATSYSLTGLNPGKAYQARVQSVCGTDVSGWKSVTFNTPFGIPLVEEFGTSIPSGWSIDTGLLATVLDDPTALGPYSYGWNFGENNGVFDNHARVNIYGTSCKYWLLLPSLLMENNVQLMFDVAYTAYSGTGAPATTGTDDKFVVLIKDNSGWNILRQWDNAGSEYVLNDLNTTPVTVTFDLSSYAGQNVIVAFYGESTESNADNNLHIDNVSIDYIPACPKPTGLAVNYTGGTEATISWTSEATAWNIDVNGTVTAITENPYTLTDLELSTDYEVKVQANCGGAESEWTNAVEFTTDACMPADMIIVNYELTDSYGDGWNDNAILVVDENCNIVEQLTIESGNSASGTLKVCGSYVQFLWYKGSYPTETSWSFTDNAGNVLFEGAGNANMATLDVLYTIDNNPYQAPTDVAASEVGPHSAKLSWTQNGDATAWQINLFVGDEEEGTIIDANSNPFVLTGLDPETEYFAQVRAIGADGTSIWTCLGADFTTTEACPVPSEIVVSNITANSALVSWIGFGESYDVKYSEVSEDGSWFYYDNGVNEDGSIGTGGGNFWWGIMIPAGSYTETNLAKTSVYDYMAMTGNVTIYNDGETAPAGEAIAQADVTLTGSKQFVETIFEEVTVDPTKNLWIIYYNGSGATYPAAYCTAQNDANGRFVSTDGTSWSDVSTAVEGCGDFMVRAFLGTLSFDWVEVNGITATEYELTGLNLETPYLVQIHSDCGADGESGWSTMTSFTTLGACGVPNSLAAEVNGTTATLSWAGAQESYNLRYWSPAHMNVFNEEDFTQVGEDYIADSVLQTYTIDLSAFSGVGNVAIRHYNITDMFRLNVDDIVLTDADGTVLVSEDFESGEMPFGWVNYDLDGDGFVWDIWNVTSLDANDNPVGNGSYCATSASYNSSGALTPDNWLIIPNVQLGGTLTFVARGQDPSWSDEVFGVFVSTNELVVPGTDPVVVENVTTPYVLTGLDPETEYEWYVEGINTDCTDPLVSETANFTTGELASQVIALVNGTNWVSFNVEITQNDLKAALVEAAPTAQIQIVGQNSQTTYNPNNHRWTGNLTFNLASMYKIKVNSACEITLQGAPVDPADHPYAINQGNNWIAFPLNQDMTLADAFAGFAVQGDQLNSQTGGSVYARRWQGSVSTLQPGKGYVYKAASGPRTLVFPTSAR